MVASALLFLFLFFFAGNDGLIRMVRLRNERTALLQKIDRMEKERAALLADIEKLKTDRQAVEHLARERYGMARPGEKVIRFVPPLEKP